VYKLQFSLHYVEMSVGAAPARSAELGARRDRRSKERREERKLFCGFSEQQIRVVASADLIQTLTRWELVR